MTKCLFNFKYQIRYNRRKVARLRDGRFTVVPVLDYADYAAKEGLRNPSYYTDTGVRYFAPDTRIYIVCLGCGSKVAKLAGDVALTDLKCSCTKSGVYKQARSILQVLQSTYTDDASVLSLVKELQSFLRSGSSVVSIPPRISRIIKSRLSGDCTVSLGYTNGAVGTIVVHCTTCGEVTRFKPQSITKVHFCNHVHLNNRYKEWAYVDTCLGAVHVPKLLADSAVACIDYIHSKKTQLKGPILSQIFSFDFPSVGGDVYSPLFKIGTTSYDILDYDDFKEWPEQSRSGMSSKPIQYMFQLYKRFSKLRQNYVILLVQPRSGKLVIRNLTKTKWFKNAYADYLAAH